MAILSNKNTRQRDFALQVPLMTSNNEPLGWQNRIALIPRYTDSSTAHTKVFTAASDYADPNNHDVSGAGWSCDIKVDWNSSGSSWYNYTYDTLSGRRGSSDAPNNGTALQDSGVYVSLYLDLAILFVPVASFNLKLNMKDKFFDFVRDSHGKLIQESFANVIDDNCFYGWFIKTCCKNSDRGKNRIGCFFEPF